MKTRILPIFYLLLAMLGISFIFSSNSGGVTGKSQTGCGGAGCHQNGSNTLITLTGIPATGYTNGQPYTITLTVGNPSKSKAGFNLTVNQGVLSAGGGMALSGTQELRHTQALNMASGVATWTFTWTAPATGTNPVTFFVAGNAVDGNGQSSNDEFNTDQFSFNAAVSTSAPSIGSSNATSITSTSATISATVNANNDATSVNIEYGPTITYGNSIVASPAVVTGNIATPISGNINGLTPGTLYNYRVVAINTIGTTNGNNGTFTTLPLSVSSIERTSIQLYPNPVENDLIYSNKDNKEQVRFIVAAMNGVVCDIPIEAVAPGEYKLSLRSLAPGNYVVFMQLGEKQYHHTILKK